MVTMSDRKKEPRGKREYDFQAFPENLELARNIEERLGRRGVPEATAQAVIREIADLLRYMTELYEDVRQGNRETAMGDSVGVATSAFVISRLGAPEYYESAAGGDVTKFVKKMGDAIAMNEIDLDLGSGRWSSTTDLLMDMLSSASVLAGTIAIEAGDSEGYNPDDLSYNVLVSCALIAAYALIVYQCAKNGSYRGQALRDLRAPKAT
jgi:hypothetical protein